MDRIEVNTYIHAPIEDVWDRLSDHEGYVRYTDLRAVRMRQEGRPHRNGVGAVREMDFGPTVLVERIERFDPPSCLEYRIIESRLPLEHHGGRIELRQRGEGTEVHWVSRFTLHIPLLRVALEPLFRMVFSDGFTTMLRRIKQELE